MITDLSLAWLEGRDKSKPFFLMHHFKAPHGPWQHAERYNDYLADAEIPEPVSLYDRGDGSIATRGKDDSLANRIGASISSRTGSSIGKSVKVDPELPEPEYTRIAYQRYLKRYLRCIKGVDDNVQRLLDYLRETGELDNTIVVYTSDQGMMLGAHDYRDKRWMYEESIRMPFIIRWPGHIAAAAGPSSWWTTPISLPH